MNELILKGKTEVEGMQFNHIEGGFGENQKSMLVKDIAEIHNRELREINERINLNRKRFKDRIDIMDLKGSKFEIGLTDSGIYTRNSINASKNIYLLSERGYSKLLKILEDDFAWEQYEKLVDWYFNMRKTQKDLKALSPELQVLINLELKQKELETSITENKQEIQDMREVISLDTTSWRKDTANLISKMALKIGGFEHIKDVREESYKLLNDRMGVALSIRLTNKRRRMADEGVSKSRRDKLNYLDIIAEDKKLIEGYVAIIKEMAIKYGVA